MVSGFPKFVKMKGQFIIYAIRNYEYQTKFLTPSCTLTSPSLKESYDDSLWIALVKDYSEEFDD